MTLKKFFSIFENLGLTIVFRSAIIASVRQDKPPTARGLRQLTEREKNEKEHHDSYLLQSKKAHVQC